MTNQEIINNLNELGFINPKSRTKIIETVAAIAMAAINDSKADPANAASNQATPSQAVNQSRGVEGSGFKFGRKSLTELEGVHPLLVRVAHLALIKSTQDFMIFDGLRTPAEQAAYVKAGNSKTMNSKHLRQSDGLSHAIDCVPVVNGIPKWDWNLIYPVIAAVDEAATELGVANKLRWGGAWDRSLADFGGRPESYKAECSLYANRHPGTDFLDGPHIELIG